MAFPLLLEIYQSVMFLAISAGTPFEPAIDRNMSLFPIWVCMIYLLLEDFVGELDFPVVPVEQFDQVLCHNQQVHRDLNHLYSSYLVFILGYNLFSTTYHM